MNVMKAIKIKKNGGIIKRKLDNGLTEVKWFWDNGQIWRHYFKDENGNFHGESKSWGENGTLWKHCKYKDGEIINVFKDCTFKRSV